MKNMTLSSIAKACKGILHAEENEKMLLVEGVVIDSRKVKKGYAFIATKGERVDGHDYIEQVYQEGASCVICERSPQLENKPYILVEDSFQALKDIAKYYREQLEVKVVGITGSVALFTFFCRSTC